MTNHEPKDHKDALTQALVLAITAPTDDDLAKVLPMVEGIAAELTPEEVAECQKKALIATESVRS